MTPSSYHSTARQHQAGMTLVELLVALSIGLFIIGAALMVFQNVTGIGRQISELTELRQEGAHAFRIIAKQVREAGAVEPNYIEDNNVFRFDSSVWDPANPLRTTPIGAWAPPAGTDFLSIAQQIPSSTAYANLLRNCLGETIATGRQRSNFYMQNSTLMCETGSNINGQPVISNVNAFKVRYRIRASETERQFVDNPTDWALVDAVEVCIDLVGTRPTPTAGNNYTNCEGNSVSLDNRLHVVQNNLFPVFSAQR